MTPRSARRAAMIAATLTQRAAWPADVGTPWLRGAWHFAGATFVGDAVPLRTSRRPNAEYRGYTKPAQTFATSPTPQAGSLDLQTGNGRRQILIRQVPGRTVPAPIP